MTTSSLAVTLQDWLDRFGGALALGDYDDAAAMFGSDACWRDLVAFTWNITTAEDPAAIRAMLAATVPLARPTAWRVQGEGMEAHGMVDGWFTFETTAGRGMGHVRLAGGRAWTLLTTLQELKGLEEAPLATSAPGAQLADGTAGRQQPYVAIVGGGQAGITLGARLKRLGVPAVIVDRHERPGDSWRTRYKSLCLHDPVWFDHLPYIPFPEDWPVFSPKDALGDWLERYTQTLGLDYWSGTTCTSARFDDADETWELAITRGGTASVVRPTHLVLAVGVSGEPNVPEYRGMDVFLGTQVHSSRFWSGEAWSGKRAVVVGSNNSAHDIAADLHAHGATVTMIQRSPTLVARASTLMELSLNPLYSKEAVSRGITTDMADLVLASLPHKVMPALQAPVYQQMKERDSALYDRLERAGFQLTFGEDGSGLLVMYLRRGSGYYVDVGASDLVADGRIGLASGEIARLTLDAVELKSGTMLPADLIVYATGFGAMGQAAARLLGQNVADKVGRCWGLGSGTKGDPGPWEGELRNMWKPTQQTNLWFHGGSLYQTRHYSQVLALQLKARMEGIATPVYARAPVHHTR